MQELRRLYQFVAVAEELHFGRAAKRLNMTQPPLSMQIHRLEEAVGARLFHRHNRLVELTVAGHTLLEEARRVLAQADRAIALTRRAAKGETGSLRIGFISTAEYSFLPALLREFHKSYPDVELTLRELTTDAQLRAFELDELDVGFVLGPVSDRRLSSIDIFTEQLVAALPAGHPAASGNKPLGIRELADEGFILPPQHMAPHHHESLFAFARAAGFTPRIEQVAVQMQTIVSLVSAGMGVAIVPECMSSAAREGVVFRELSPAPPQFSTLIVWQGDRIPATTAQFIDLSRRRSANPRKRSSGSPDAPRRSSGPRGPRR